MAQLLAPFRPVYVSSRVVNIHDPNYRKKKKKSSSGINRECSPSGKGETGLGIFMLFEKKIKRVHLEKGSEIETEIYGLGFKTRSKPSDQSSCMCKIWRRQKQGAGQDKDGKAMSKV